MNTEPDPDVPFERLSEPLERLADDLRAVFASDDAPPRVLEGARAAWTWRLIDSELAELVEQDQVVLRAGGTALVTFAAGEVFLDIERAQGPSAGTELVVGQLTAPAELASVEAELAVDPPLSLAADVDAGGGFRVVLPEGVLARLVVRMGDGRRVVSSWLA